VLMERTFSLRGTLNPVHRENRGPPFSDILSLPHLKEKKENISLPTNANGQETQCQGS